jgi:hemoglobin-like flavoprotein
MANKVSHGFSSARAALASFLDHSAYTGKWRTPLTPEQIQLVQASFAKIAPIARPVAALFYQRLFNLDPTVEALFKGDMREHGRRLMSMIGTAVNGLDQLDSIVPAVKALGARHAHYGVEDAHYATAGAALMWTLEQALGDDFTPSVSAGWSATFELLTDTMQAAAREAGR